MVNFFRKIWSTLKFIEAERLKAMIHSGRGWG